MNDAQLGPAEEIQAEPAKPHKDRHLWHGVITLMLILISAAISATALYLLANRELPESAGILVGSVVTGWFSAMSIALAWWYSSTFGSKAKTDLLARKDGK